MTNNAGLKFSDALPAGWAVVTGAASGLGFAGLRRHEAVAFELPTIRERTTSS
jgi:hypothetical protein